MSACQARIVITRDENGAPIYSHHSDDVVTVHSGRAEPVTLCGYHASSPWISDALATVPK